METTLKKLGLGILLWVAIIAVIPVVVTAVICLVILYVQYCLDVGEWIAVALLSHQP